MTNQEFLNGFDVLYNNITSNQAPGLNPYEISLFLTKAQYEILKNYFSAKGNLKQEGFDESPKRQIDYSMLIETANAVYVDGVGKVDPRAYKFKLPSDLMYIINESVQFGGKTKVLRQVVPLSYEEYTRLMSQPFKEPTKYQAWRLITGKDKIDNKDVPTVDLIITSDDKDSYIGKSSVGSVLTYSIRYVRKPNPIILCNLSSIDGSLKIEGISANTPCELPAQLHEEILQRAVELAKVAWTTTGQENTQLFIEAGKRSE